MLVGNFPAMLALHLVPLLFSTWHSLLPLLASMVKYSHTRPSHAGFDNSNNKESSKHFS